MKTTALIERGKDGKYSVYTPDLVSTIVGEGMTVAEAKADFENTLKEVIESFAEGEDMGEFKNLQIVYKYDVASVFNYFDFINATKFAKWAGINAGLMRQYKTSSAYISEAQAQKIERALHTIGRELSSVSL